MNKLLLILTVAVVVIIATSNMWGETPEMCLSQGVPTQCSLFIK